MDKSLGLALKSWKHEKAFNVSRNNDLFRTNCWM